MRSSLSDEANRGLTGPHGVFAAPTCTATCKSEATNTATTAFRIEHEKGLMRNRGATF